jgi:hypothetical protein
MTVICQRATRNTRKSGDSVDKIKMDMIHSHVRQPADTNGFASVTTTTMTAYPSQSAHRMWRATPFGGIVLVHTYVNVSRQTADIAALIGVPMCLQTWK